VGDLLVRFAKCCPPVPGDPIVGYHTRGRGITVHLGRCATVVNEREAARLIDVEWETAPARRTHRDPRGATTGRPPHDIAGAVAESKVNILPANVAVSQDHTATVMATLEVASVSQLAA